MHKTNFAVFILTNRRPDKIFTVKSLLDSGYTGKIYFIVDDMDPTIDEYKRLYTESVIVFSKKDAMTITDTADNTNNEKAVVYARNMCWQIAKNLDLDYFLVLDDDYTAFDYKTDENGNYKSHVKIRNIDKIIDIFIEFLKKTPTKSIAFCQGGDYIGGYGNIFGEKSFLDRKLMNSFFCKTDKPFMFYGLINEDVTCYTLNASRGDIFFSCSDISLEQKATQQNSGGLTTIYLELGTYVKSFYSVVYHPSSIRVKEMGLAEKRLHHSINRDLTYPKILSENLKKT